MTRLTPAQRKMLKRLQEEPSYRPKRALGKRRLRALVDKGAISMRGNRVTVKNPASRGDRIIVVREEGRDDVLYLGHTGAGDPKRPLAALGRGNPRPLRLETSWRADRGEYNRLVAKLAGHRVNGCWYDATAVRKVQPK